MTIVLESTKYVVDNSKYVQINQEKIDEFCKNFKHDSFVHWITSFPMAFPDLNDEEKLNFLLVFNSMSFCYWGEPKWTIEHKGEKLDGAWAMIASLKSAIENKVPLLSAHFLEKISKQELNEILKGNIVIPLFEERWEILREIGSKLMKRHHGQFSELIKKADKDAVALAELIVKTFPFFNDSAEYKGKKIYFYKRAQLLVSDIYKAFHGKSYGLFKNTNKLTACADYKLPYVLRKLGIISYSPELAKKIDNKIEIPKNSEEEVEIRANTIWAIEFIKRDLKKKIPHITSIELNDHIWLAGQEKSEKPYHRTRTIFY